MAFLRRTVRVDPTVQVVTPIEQPVVRHVTVERTGMSPEASVILILAGIAVLALVWYLAWFRPQSQTIIETTSPAVIERTSTTEITNNPAPVIQTPPPVVIQPPPVRVETPPATSDPIIITPQTPTSEDTTGGR